jgi:hypothetical protein
MTQRRNSGPQRLMGMGFVQACCLLLLPQVHMWGDWAQTLYQRTKIKDIWIVDIGFLMVDTGDLYQLFLFSYLLSENGY